jgi:phosphothreonine lyase
MLSVTRTNTLDLPAPPLRLFSSAGWATQRHLSANFERLTQGIRNAPAPSFREAAPATYWATQNGFTLLHNGFRLNNNREDAFIHAHREQAQYPGAYAGDKFHLSVKPEQVPRAFDALSGLLFSDHSPIDQWKVTDMARVSPGERVSEAAQFTLYVKPDGTDLQYTAKGLNNLRHFMAQLESVMVAHGIQPGQHPDSDVRPAHWQFSSYRNELRGEREDSEIQSAALRNELFYRLITEV